MTTTSISTLLLPDTLLFRGSISRCCIAGFHTYDYEPGDSSNGNVEKRYVTNYSGWFQPGLWLDGTGDVTPLSHEMSEIFNDPFVFSDSIHDLTPWWLSANGQCQDNLEVGDVVERLPKQFYPITMNGMIYHLQNEALLQWFEGKQSDAIDGAYSYPNESVLTNPMVSQKPFCQ
jgi:hypothetical protein